MARKKKVGRKPVTRIPIDDSISGVTEEAEDVDDKCSFEGLNLIVDLMKTQDLIVTEENEQSAIYRAKSWAVEVEEELVRTSNVEQSPNSAKKNWESFIRGKTLNRDQRLLFTKPLIRDGIKITQVDLEEVCEEENCWKSAIICKVLGANPPITIFKGFIKRVWGHLGVVQVSKMSMGLIMVWFRDEATRDQVLEVGVVQFDKNPVIIRPWSADVNAMNLIHSVPLWIKFHDLGLQYWGTKSLSALVSTIGKPITVDQHTKDRTRLQFARILVEMEVTDAPPRFIPYINESQQQKEWVLPKKTAVLKPKPQTEAAGDKTEQFSNIFTVLQEQQEERVDDQEATEQTESGGIKLEKWLIENSRIGIIILVLRLSIEFLSLWRKCFARVIVVREELQFVHCYVKVAGQTNAMSITFVYGFNIVKEQKGMWLITGAFNALFDLDDRKGGKSWETILDHCACVISMATNEKIGFKPFRYYNFWVDHPNFKKVVLKDWNRPLKVEGMNALFLKLMRLKHAIKRFNREVIGDIGRSYHEAKDNYLIARLQIYILDNDLSKSNILLNIDEWKSAREFQRQERLKARAQLIHSGLLGLRNYWMSIFILPHSITREIEKLCRGFLWGWNGNRSKLHVALWEKVYLQKNYGGLGFKDVVKWNQAVLAKYIWAISSKSDLLWVKWVNNIYLKNNSIWTYVLKNDTSWGSYYHHKKVPSNASVVGVLSNTGKHWKESFFFVLKQEAILELLCMPPARPSPTLTQKEYKSSLLKLFRADYDRKLCHYLLSLFPSRKAGEEVKNDAGSDATPSQVLEGDVAVEEVVVDAAKEVPIRPKPSPKGLLAKMKSFLKKNIGGQPLANLSSWRHSDVEERVGSGPWSSMPFGPPSDMSQVGAKSSFTPLLLFWPNPELTRGCPRSQLTQGGKIPWRHPHPGGG
uniref:DUF4283 domain-containing protein n=1 Tax=Cannabis sativa TaxID=3483 RepID=A0A803QD36_CANSA